MTPLKPFSRSVCQGLTSLAVLGLLCVSASAAEQHITLSPLSDGDLGARALSVMPDDVALPSINTRRETVRYAHVLDADASIAAVQQPFVAQSREYWLDVSAAQLASGVSLPITSRGAVLRLSPLSAHKADAVSVDQIELIQSGQVMDAATAFDRVADAQALKSAGMSVGEQTIAMRLSDQVEVGEVMLRSASVAGRQIGYVLHVFEPESAQVLSLNTTSMAVINGQPLRVQATLEGLNEQMTAADVSGYIVSPDGATSYPLTFSGQGTVTADLDTRQLYSAGEGLWEAHTFVRHQGTDQMVMRDAKVAFAVTPATARLAGQVALSQRSGNADSFSMSVAVEVAVAGRYEVSAVISGDDGYGRQIPGVMTMTAGWLDQSGTLVLEVPAEQLLEAGIAPPYTVGHLTLKDQTRMATLWQQNQAFEVPELTEYDRR